MKCNFSTDVKLLNGKITAALWDIFFLSTFSTLNDYVANRRCQFVFKALVQSAKCIFVSYSKSDCKIKYQVTKSRFCKLLGARVWYQLINTDLIEVFITQCKSLVPSGKRVPSGSAKKPQSSKPITIEISQIPESGM